MSIDVLSDDLVTIAESAKVFPPGRRPSTQSIYRYMTKGIRGVVLRSVLLLGQRHTTREAIHEFLEECSKPTQCRLSPKPQRRTRQREIEKAERELAKEGL